MLSLADASITTRPLSGVEEIALRHKILGASRRLQIILFGGVLACVVVGIAGHILANMVVGIAMFSFAGIVVALRTRKIRKDLAAGVVYQWRGIARVFTDEGEVGLIIQDERYASEFCEFNVSDGDNIEAEFLPHSRLLTSVKALAPDAKAWVRSLRQTPL